VLKEAEAVRVIRPSLPDIDMEAVVAQTAFKGSRDRRINKITILIRDLLGYVILPPLGWDVGRLGLISVG
jgi:hypothetical protein